MDPQIRALIRRMCEANPLWGAHGELLKLGISVSEAVVSKYMIRTRNEKPHQFGPRYAPAPSSPSLGSVAAQDRGVRRMLRCLAIEPAVARRVGDGPRPVQFRPLCLFNPSGGTRTSFTVPFHPDHLLRMGRLQNRRSKASRHVQVIIIIILPRRHGALMSATHN